MDSCGIHRWKPFRHLWIVRQILGLSSLPFPGLSAERHGSRPGVRRYDSGRQYAYDFNDNIRWDVSYLHTDADLDFAYPYRVARDVNSRKEDLATTKLDYDVTDKVSLYVKAYYHLWSTHYDTYYNDLANPGTIDVLYQDAFWGYRDYGANALAKLSLTKGLDYYIGYDMQRYNGKDEVLVIQSQTETTNAIFGQVRTTNDLLENAKFAARRAL